MVRPSTSSTKVPSIHAAIVATLLTVPSACTQFTTSCPKTSKTKEPFDVEGTSFTEAEFDMRAAALGGDTSGTPEYGVDEFYTLAWQDIDDADLCQAACAFALDFSGSGYADQEFRINECFLELDDDGGVVTCRGKIVTTPFCEGRRPIDDRWTPNLLGPADQQAQLDACVRLEWASVRAFRELAAELTHLDAPRQLVDRALDAARDEVRHVALLLGLGARLDEHLGEPLDEQPANQSDVGTRIFDEALDAQSRLYVLALDNATEGCVAETWAALMARHRSEHARDPAVRHAYARIADDETRHAQFAWELHAWYLQRLRPELAAQVESARNDALAALPTTAVQQMAALDESARTQLGLPGLADADRLAHEYVRRLG